MISEIQKQEIQRLTSEYVAKFSSQKKAANSLSDFSEASLIQVLKGNWDKISEKLWYTLANQVGYKKSGDWQIALTRGFKILQNLLEDARTNSLVYGVIAQEGFGKSETGKFITSHPQVFYVECAEYLSKKLFLSELCKTMGLESSGQTGDMMASIIRYVSQLDSPLIIMDEADKLPDKSLSFFITLCNKLQDRCGIVIMGTDHLEKKIDKGVRINRQGYKEIFSRIGRRFVQIPPHELDDVKKVCEINGLEDPAEIHRIYNQFEGDLRRVKKMVHAYNRNKRKTAA